MVLPPEFREAREQLIELLLPKVAMRADDPAVDKILAAAFNAWVERVAGEGLEGAVEGLARAHCDCGPPPASLGDAAPHACALSIVPEVVAAVAPLLAARDRRVEELEGELRRCVREANEKICRLLSESDKSTLEVPLVRSRLLGQIPWAASMKADPMTAPTAAEWREASLAIAHTCGLRPAEAYCAPILAALRPLIERLEGGR